MNRLIQSPATKRCLIWGGGTEYDWCIRGIQYEEVKGHIQIVGIVGDNLSLYESVDSYQVLPKSELSRYKIDYVIITTMKYFDEIAELAMSEFGFDRSQIIPGRVFNIPGFDFQDYIHMLVSRPTLLCNYCFGGMAYHYLSMQMMSPLIDLRILPEDYMKIISSPYEYLNYSLTFQGIGVHKEQKYEYPIVSLGDANLHFIHSPSKEEYEIAKADFERRRERINWDNLIIVMIFRDEQDIALYGEAFEKLEFAHKIGFAPIETEYSSIFCLKGYQPDPTKVGMFQFPQYVNRIVTENFIGIRPFDIIKLMNGNDDFMRVK